MYVLLLQLLQVYLVYLRGMKLGKGLFIIYETQLGMGGGCPLHYTGGRFLVGLSLSKSHSDSSIKCRCLPNLELTQLLHC